MQVRGPPPTLPPPCGWRTNGLGLLLQEDPGEAEDEQDQDQDEEDLHPHCEPHQPAGSVRALAAILAVGGTLLQRRLAAIAVGLLDSGCHTPSMPNRGALYSSEHGCRGIRSQ